MAEAASGTKEAGPGDIKSLILPRNLEAEEGVIGCLILAPKEVIPLVSKIVSGDQFFDTELGKLFTVCSYLSEAGKPIDNYKWLLGELPKHGVNFEMATMVRLATQQPNWSHAVYFAEQVRDTSRLRKFIGIGSRLVSMAHAKNAEPRDLESWFDAQAVAARHGEQGTDELIGDVMQKVVTHFEERLHSGNKPVLLSGFPSADERGFVFAPGELTVLAARTGMGKTTLATQVGMHHALQGRAVLMASLEMRTTEVAGRLLAASSGNNYQTIRMGMIDEICIQQMRAEADRQSQTPFWLWSPGRVKVGQIHAMASMRKAASNIELLIVDLLQCVKWDQSKDEEHHAYGKVTKGLRDIAQQLQIPVMLIAQLSRGAEGERPTLKHLKGSGAIEEDADIVALLHAERHKSSVVDLIVEKNRFGSPGTAQLRFVASESRFADPSQDARANPNYRSEFDSYNNQ